MTTLIGVRLGSDFDGIPPTLQQLDDVTSFSLITKAFLKRGYMKKQGTKIPGANFLRVLKQNNPH